MTREETAEIDRQAAECDALLVRMREHRECLERLQSGTAAEVLAVNKIVAKMHESAPQYVDNDCLQRALEATVGMLGEEIGLIERTIRADMIARQDDAFREINERLDGIDGRLDELASRLDQIEGDVADIERSAKVTLLKRGSRRVA